jgi:hypothetical protein
MDGGVDQAQEGELLIITDELAARSPKFKSVPPVERLDVERRPRDPVRGREPDHSLDA